MAARLVLAGLLALASGAVFRLHLNTGAPLFRMLATILLVATGLLLASAVERWQIRQALAELEHRLATGAEVTCLALPRSLARRYRWERGYLAVGPGGVMLLAAVGLSDAAWSVFARSALRGHAASLRRAVRELKARVLPRWPAGQPLPEGTEAGAGPAGRAAATAPANGGKAGARERPPEGPQGQLASGGRAVSVPAFGMVVLLRRRVLPVERDMLRLQGVGLANPTHFPRALEVVAQSSVPGLVPLPPAWQRAVRDAAQQVWNARELAAPAGVPPAGKPAPASKG